MPSACKVPTLAARARIAFSTPACWTPPDQPAGTLGTCPGVEHHLRSRPVSNRFETSAGYYSRSTARSLLDTVTPCLFPALSPPRLSCPAAVGGLMPPLARRLRGPCPSHTQHSCGRGSALLCAFAAHIPCVNWLHRCQRSRTVVHARDRSRAREAPTESRARYRRFRGTELASPSVEANRLVGCGLIEP